MANNAIMVRSTITRSTLHLILPAINCHAHRQSLAMVFLLVDSTVKPQQIDLDYANWLTENKVPFSIAFTKYDKKRKGVST